MRNYLYLIILYIAACTVSACEKNNLTVEEGIFKGTFTYDDGKIKRIGTTTLTLKDGKFTCEGNEENLPAGGSGNYSFDENKITFIDLNVWKAIYDWNLILNGQYDYSYDGKNLKLTPSVSAETTHEYNLVRQ